MYYLTKLFRFEAAHRLNKDYDPQQPCAKIHGHSYSVWITFMCTALNDAGMVFDFALLKNLKKRIDMAFDHKLLLQRNDPMIILKTTEGENITILRENPTCEFISKTICDMATVEIQHMLINEYLPQEEPTIFVDNVTVQETATGSAKYQNPEAEYVRFLQMRAMHESREGEYQYLVTPAGIKVGVNVPIDGLLCNAHGIAQCSQCEGIGFK